MDSSIDSTEIVEDFKEALQDLRSNSKHEIDNLTLIANENSTHAEAISKVLEEHIAKTRPDFKMPAFYVLDSIIRHVGPPYSTYLGKNLFNTFMGAYRQVNDNVRREMEMVLKTWKEPVQGLRDPKPVLEPHVTRDIENALIRFRTVLQQQEARQQSNLQTLGGMYQAPGVPYRNSPVPMGQQIPGTTPQAYSSQDLAAFASQMQQRTGTPNSFMNAQIHPGTIRSPVSHPQVSQGTPVSLQGTPVNYGLPTPQTSQGPLTTAQVNEAAEGIRRSLDVQMKFGSVDPEIPKLMETLDRTKALLNSQTLDQTSLRAIQDQLSVLSRRTQENFSSLMGHGQVSATQSIPNSLPSAHLLLPTSFSPPISSPPPSLPFLPPSTTPGLPPSMLISLLSQQPGNLPLAPPHTTPAPPPSDANNFLQQLRSVGLLPATPTPPVPETRIKGSKYGVALSQDSIIKVRKHIIDGFFQSYSDQCGQCGRRFLGNAEGKKLKMEHLDWHFKINSRVAEYVGGGIVHRSAYLDELQWTKLQEHSDGTEATSKDSGSAKGSGSQRPEEQFVPAPTDVNVLKKPCSICMEPFKTIWHEKTQQPVWMDAIKVGNKYYHASCYSEMTRSSDSNVSPNSKRSGGGGSKGNVGSARNTPDPILGKRKYERRA